MIEEIQRKLDIAFKDLKFDPIKHIYRVNGIIYPSVSSLVKKHHKEFDFQAKSIGTAYKTGVEVEEVRRSWRTTNEIACDLGHQTHSFLENYDGRKKGSTHQQLEGIRFLQESADRYTIIAREIKMYSRKYKYAGTADLLLWDFDLQGIVIADYKTNKTLFGRVYNKMLPPFEYLDEVNYNKYQIQLSYYQILLEEADIPIVGRLLIYLPPDGEYDSLDTQDFTKELKNGIKVTTKLTV